MVVLIYEATRNFPETEKCALSSQLKRSAISIPSNIAEGFGRKGNKELVQFLYISLGSLAELETQLEIAFRISYLSDLDLYSEKIKFIRVLLSRLIESVKANQKQTKTNHHNHNTSFYSIKNFVT